MFLFLQEIKSLQKSSLLCSLQVDMLPPPPKKGEEFFKKSQSFKG